VIIDLNWNKEFAKEREGTVLHDNGNHKVYKCPAGYLTAGWGHNLDAHGVLNATAEEWLRQDLAAAQREVSKNVDAWDKLNAPRKSVLIDMVFNMGWPTLSKFKKFLAALDNEDYEKAAIEMEDSKWFKQVGIRAEMLQSIMLSGEYP